MTIGIDASRANIEFKTGVEWYGYYLIQELKKVIPDTIQVVLYSDTELQGELADLPSNWKSKVLKWPLGKLWTQVRLSFEMLINAPGILFIPSHVFPIIHPKKTAMTVHDVGALKFPESYSAFQRWYTTWSASYAVRNLWRVIVPSEFTKKELSGNSKNVFMVHDGYNKSYRVIDDNERTAEVLSQYGIQKPFALSLGRLEEKKNTARVIKAFEKVKSDLRNRDLKLVLVGKPGYGYEKVDDALGNSRNAGDIIRAGWVAEEDMPFIMNSAEVLVFPSLYEGFGLPVIQALACGLPVVASAGSGLEEVGGDSVFYAEPMNEDDIAAAINTALHDEAQRSDKRKLGLARAEEFSWRNCALKTLQAFDLL